MDRLCPKVNLKKGDFDLSQIIETLDSLAGNKVGDKSKDTRANDHNNNNLKYDDKTAYSRPVSHPVKHKEKHVKQDHAHERDRSATQDKHKKDKHSTEDKKLKGNEKHKRELTRTQGNLKTLSLIGTYHIPVYTDQPPAAKQVHLIVDIPGPTNLTKNDKTIIRNYPQDVQKWIARHNKHSDYYKRHNRYVYIVTTLIYDKVLKYKVGLIKGGLKALRKQYSRYHPNRVTYLLHSGGRPLEKAILNHPDILPYRERGPRTESGRLGKRSEWIVGLTLGQLVGVFGTVLGQGLIVSTRSLGQ